MGHTNGTNGATKQVMDMERLIPHSREAELSVIGSLLIDPDALLEVIGWLQSDHFYGADCRMVYQAILDLHGQNTPHDLVTLSSYFERLGNEDQNRMVVFMMGALNEVPTSINVKHYAEIVRERAIRRALISTCAKGSTMAYDTTTPIDDVVSEFQADVFRATTASSRSRLSHVKDAVRDYLEQVENARMNPQSLAGLSTGLKAVDGVMGGLRKQDLIVLAADTSMGKTAGALNLTNNLTKAKKNGLFVSLEMSTAQLLNRIASMRIGVDWKSLQTGNITQEQMTRLYSELGKLSDSSLYIDDTPAQTPEQIMSNARKLAMTHGLDYIFVDYLGMMHIPEARGDSYKEVSIASKRLKDIAKELDVPVIVLAQINRENKKRGDKRPQMSDLRDSGKIEENADVIVFLYRDEYFNPDSTEQRGIAEWIIRKNRTGGTLGTAETFLKVECGLFTDLQRQQVNL